MRFLDTDTKFMKIRFLTHASDDGDAKRIDFFTLLFFSVCFFYFFSVFLLVFSPKKRGKKDLKVSEEEEHTTPLRRFLYYTHQREKTLQLLSLYSY